MTSEQLRRRAEDSEVYGGVPVFKGELGHIYRTLADLTDEVVALRTETDEKLTLISGCFDDLKERVMGLERKTAPKPSFKSPYDASRRRR